MIAVQIVSPDNLKPENRTCKIDGLIYTRGADELPADFDSRMMAVADGLNRQSGRLVHLVLSPDDLAA